MGWDIPLGCGVRTQLRPLLLGLTGTQLTLLMVLCCWSESSIGAAPRVPQIHSLRRGQWQGRAPPPKRAVPCCVSHTAIQGGHGEAGLSSQKYLCPPKHCCWGPASWLEITLSGVAFRGQGRPTPGRSVLLLPTVVDGKWRFLASHTGVIYPSPQRHFRLLPSQPTRCCPPRGGLHLSVQRHSSRPPGPN